MNGVIDYWCNIFTPEGIRECFTEQPELAEVFRWWSSRTISRVTPPGSSSSCMDRAGVEMVLVPAAKMHSFQARKLIWDVPVDAVAELVGQAPDRIRGLFGIDPRERMRGVRELEDAVRRQGVFVGAHLHPYGFGLGLNHAAYYPFYAKCVELDVPLVMQVGHSAEAMPIAVGRPILLDDVALDFPELRIVGGPHRLAVGRGADRAGLEAPEHLRRHVGTRPEATGTRRCSGSSSRAAKVRSSSAPTTRSCATRRRSARSRRSGSGPRRKHGSSTKPRARCSSSEPPDEGGDVPASTG